MGYFKSYFKKFLESKIGKLADRYVWKLVQMLRANPLGPPLTVCLSGLLAVFVMPQLTLWLVFAPKFILTQILLSAPFVPYCLYRVHRVPWKPLAALWAGIYLLALIQTPNSLRVMPAFALSAHFSTYFIWGFVLSAGFGMFWGKKPVAATPPRTSVMDTVSRAS